MHHQRGLLAVEQPMMESANHSAQETWCAAASRREPPFIAETRRFFGQQELIANRAQFPLYDLPQLYQAVEACFPDWRLLVEGGPPCTGTQMLWLPETTRMLIAPGRWADYAHEATRFYRLPDGGRRVLGIESWQLFAGDRGFSVQLIGPRSQQEQLGREWGELLARMERPHYLQGQVLRPNASILEDLPPCGWHDVALEPGMRQAVEQNTVEILRRRDTFRRHGVPLKRGILLSGPPGTGKTLLAKVLAGLGLATFIYATANDMAVLNWARDVFELARKLAPTILLLEDLDLYAVERTYSKNGVLGEMLTQLDGFENNDGLIFIGTTNDLEAIDPALRERPSRFDVVLRLGLPTCEARRKILARNLPVGSASDGLLDQAAADTDGLSGAQVREVAYLALQKAVLRDESESDAPLALDAKDVMDAIGRLRGKREASIGFGGASVP
ncbi:MAG TPA: ATP-binding protein [Pirellulales bacterium]|nr:ATP-binding protein [Pirellulales bacterium]